MFYQMTRFLLNCSTGYPDSIGVHVKNIFHAPHKLGANSRNAPFLLYVKLNSFFLTSFRTVSCEILSTIFNSTNRSAKSCNVQRFRPSGGLL